jgi:hypothetical protein
VRWDVSPCPGKRPKGLKQGDREALSQEKGWLAQDRWSWPLPFIAPVSRCFRLLVLKPILAALRGPRAHHMEINEPKLFMANKFDFSLSVAVILHHM